MIKEEDNKIIVKRNSYDRLCEYAEKVQIEFIKDSILEMRSNVQQTLHKIKDDFDVIMINILKNENEFVKFQFVNKPKPYLIKNNIGVIPFMLSFENYNSILGVIYINTNDEFSVHFPESRQNNILFTIKKEVSLIEKNMCFLESFPDLIYFKQFLSYNIIEEVRKVKITCTEDFQKRLVDSPFCISSYDCPEENITCKNCKLKYIDWEIIEGD